MAGQPVGRIVAEEARQYGWAELHDAYSSRLQPVLAAPSSEAL